MFGEPLFHCEIPRFTCYISIMFVHKACLRVGLSSKLDFFQLSRNFHIFLGSTLRPFTDNMNYYRRRPR